MYFQLAMRKKGQGYWLESELVNWTGPYLVDHLTTLVLLWEVKRSIVVKMGGLYLAVTGLFCALSEPH